MTSFSRGSVSWTSCCNVWKQSLHRLCTTSCLLVAESVCYSFMPTNGSVLLTLLDVLPCQSLNLSVCSTVYQYFWFPTFREKDKIMPSDPLKLVTGHVTCLGETKVIINHWTRKKMEAFKNQCAFYHIAVPTTWLVICQKVETPLASKWIWATIWPRDFTSRYLSKENENINLKMYMHSSGHGSTLYNIQVAEAT